MLNADLIDTIIVAYSLIKKKQILIFAGSACGHQWVLFA